MGELNLIDYIQWLVSTNVACLAKENKGFPDAKAHFIIGMIEEYFEWLTCPFEKEILELGDVLAYYCLAMISLGFTAKEITEYLSNQQETNSNAIPETVSAGKRVLRGDAGAEVLFANSGAKLLLYLVETTEDHMDLVLSIEFIATLNKNKLEQRLESVGTFKGSGDR